MESNSSIPLILEFILTEKEKIKNEVEEILALPVENMPSLEDMQDPSIRYEANSKAADLNRRIGSALANAWMIKSEIIHFKSMVSKKPLSSTVINQIKLQIENITDELECIIQSAKSLKESCDKQLKCFESSSYMFGGIIETKSRF